MVSFKISCTSLCPRKCENEIFCQRIRTQSTFGNFEILNFQKKNFCSISISWTPFGPPENGIKSQDTLESLFECSRTSTAGYTLLTTTNGTLLPLLYIPELYLGQPLELEVILDLVIFETKMALYQLPISSPFQPAD